MIQETELILSFIKKDKRERYLSLLRSEKGRAKLRLRLPHLHDLNPAYLHKISPSKQNIRGIIRQLIEYKAPSVCYVIAEHSRYDQKSMLLDDAFQELFSSGIAYFISCIPGKLAYYEGEDLNERYLLLR